MTIAATIHSIGHKAARKLGITPNSIIHKAARKLGIKADPWAQPSAHLHSFAGSVNDVPIEERFRTAMHRAFYENIGSDVGKWRHYLDVYDRYLSHYCGKPVNILEIGVGTGGSLTMWRRYFGADAKIFGIDINPECGHLDGIDAEIRIGSQADSAFLKSVIAEMSGVDVIIDDGSHKASHQRVSFESLFPLLDANGIYICEDTHTAYWREYEGRYRRKTNFLEIAKRIIDDIHCDFHGHPPSVKDANRMIKGIHIYNSMVVIEKAPQPDPMFVVVH
jgi:hypothetical protein